MTIVQLKGISLAYPHKSCFSDFHAKVGWGQRIAIVGDNGSGKSSLLRMLNGELAPNEGSVVFNSGLVIGYVPQVLTRFNQMSGGERVNTALTDALAKTPDMLLLDEPTNHLDHRNRVSLARMLEGFQGTIIIVTHDIRLMDQLCDTLWYIARDRIVSFNGRYADFQAERALQRLALEKKISALERSSAQVHQALMQEQERASHARKRGEKSIKERKWATVRSVTKLGRGNTTGVDQAAKIRLEQHDLSKQLKLLSLGEVIIPRFHFPGGSHQAANVLQVSNGGARYTTTIFKQLNLAIAHGERLALLGDNGSGKSTLARAILGDPSIERDGAWIVPSTSDIGYLDQHYADLSPDLSVLQIVQAAAPGWSMTQLRRHLNDFLFRHQQAVDAKVATLSGGERARLALARIAARPPTLLILDEVTNNLDIQTRQHVIDVLGAFPGSMLLISHDPDFLNQIGVKSGLRMVPGQVPRFESIVGG